MTVRIKLGPFASIGRTGIRLHGNLLGITGSIGRGGWRLFTRRGPFYGMWSGRR